ncbi:DmsE family decaheme c-type cytochrome [Herbaspirillum sp. HC18]|nr:DmsE family decaheme c-type cytochrome [Herbaspirillum sp. HC18]
MRPGALVYALLRIMLATHLLFAVTAMAQVAAPEKEGNDAATYVGEKICTTCHAAENNHFGHTVHARTFRQNPRNEREKRVCEACHGPGSRHVANVADHDSLIGFTRKWGTPVEKQNTQCLGCHQGRQRIYWPGSPHESNQIACSDCHNPMARFSATGLLKKASVSETCYTCHQQQRAEFRKRSHMPLPEGKMSCENCHNPHGSPTRPLLNANSVNDVCYSCHAEKRGPFLWEHAPVRENCLNCHEAHGSNQEALLVAARPFLCQQCHTNRTHQNKLATVPNLASGAEPNERVIGRSCQTCHAQIHGSNHPSGVRFHR